MRTRWSLLLLCILALIAGACSPVDEFPVLEGPYLGQTPPAGEPELFAPGVLSTGMYERDITMTPGGDEIYFGMIFGRYVTVACTRLEKGRWTRPEVASFASDPAFGCFEPHVTPDGKRMLFLSTRPPEGKEPAPGWFYQNIWAANRRDDGTWDEPYALGDSINTDDFEYYPSVTSDGTLYFTRQKRGLRETKIYRSRMVGGWYSAPEELPEPVNGTGNIYNAFVSPDESYLLACIEGLGDGFAGDQANYYVFFNDGDDSWSGPVNLGETINHPGVRATSQFVSPDGRYLFFASTKTRAPGEIASGGFTYDLLRRIYMEAQNGDSDIYWVDAAIIEKLRP